MDTLRELLVDELKDLWSAENQLTKALPKLVKGAASSELAAAFREHLEVTKTQMRRIEEIFERHLDASPRGKKCVGMEGLIKEGAEMLKEKGEDAVIDAGLITAAQKVEHYEIGGYGSAIAHAKLLGLDEIVELLHESLVEEKTADETLSSLAEGGINEAALAAGKEAMFSGE
jgi:ferritin-like metal-binding protein YciE